MGKEYRKQLLDKSLEKLVYLPARDQKILRMRYGIGESEKSLKHIAATFHVSEQTIRKYEALAIRKLELLVIQ